MGISIFASQTIKPMFFNHRASLKTTKRKRINKIETESMTFNWKNFDFKQKSFEELRVTN